MARLSQTNPELFENPTLGEATTAPFLDQVEAQKREDFNARHEGRDPKTVVALNRIPGKFKPSGSVPSSYTDQVAFEEGSSVDNIDEVSVDETQTGSDYYGE